MCAEPRRGSSRTGRASCPGRRRERHPPRAAGSPGGLVSSVAWEGGSGFHRLEPQTRFVDAPRGRVACRPMSRTASLRGWGRTAPTTATVLVPRSPEDVSAAVSAAGPRGIIARGLGRSYGDPAQNAGGAVLDMTALATIHSIDAESGIVDLDAGVSLDTLMRVALPYGLWVPVLPGTRQVTIGGAIGSDIHGKNHHTTGSFGNHVRSLDLLTADGTVRTLTPDGPDADLFWATVGGIGLTGVIVRATVALHRTESAYFVVDTDRTADLDEPMGRSPTARTTPTTTRRRGSTRSPRARSSGGRCSPAARSPRSTQLPAKLRQRPPEVRRPAAADPARRLPERAGQPATRCGRSASSGTARPRSASVARSRTSRPSTTRSTCSGTGTGSTGHAASCSTSSSCRSARSRRSARSSRSIAESPHVSFLNVLKRFGEGNAAPLSFPQPGWTISVDFPIVRGLHRFCSELDELVLGAGGRLYPAKESRAERRHVPQGTRGSTSGARCATPSTPTASSPPTWPEGWS